MSICVCRRTYICKCVHPSMHAQLYIDICIHTCIRTYIHTYMNAYIDTYIPRDVRAPIHPYRHTCATNTQKHNQTHSCVHTCQHAYTHTHIYIHIHIHIHIHVHSRRLHMQAGRQPYANRCMCAHIHVSQTCTHVYTIEKDTPLSVWLIFHTALFMLDSSLREDTSKYKCIHSCEQLQLLCSISCCIV